MPDFQVLGGGLGTPQALAGGQYQPLGSEESQMSEHCPQALAIQYALTSSGQLSLVFPRSPDGCAEPVECSGTSTLCPHHTAFSHTSNNEMASVAACRIGLLKMLEGLRSLGADGRSSWC